MNKKKLIWQVPFLLFLIIGTVVILEKQPPFRANEGLVFGTIYKITYQHQDDLHQDIKEALKEVDNSLSPYNPHSIITSINNNTRKAPWRVLTSSYSRCAKDGKKRGAFYIVEREVKAGDVIELPKFKSKGNNYGVGVLAKTIE